MKIHSRIISILFIICFCFFNSCNRKLISGNTGISDINKQTDSIFRIYKIDSINNYYLVYAKSNNLLYKIVSKKEVTKKCKRVKVNSEYKFSLKSVWNQKIMIGNVNASPSLMPHVTCLSFDKSTVICLERDSINDLFITKNLRGLCLTNN